MTSRGGEPQLVYFSTSSVYGASSAAASEQTPPEPSSPYGHSKLAAEGILARAVADGEIVASIVRPFTLFGEAQRKNMAIARLIECALNGGTFHSHGPLHEIRRDWTYVGDAIQVVEQLLTLPAIAWPEVINIGTGYETSLLQIVEMLECTCGLARPEILQAKTPATPHVRADVGLLRKLFPQHRPTPLTEGVRRQVEAAMA